MLPHCGAAQVNARDDRGRTALVISVQGPDPARVWALVQHGALPGVAEPTRGWLPLHIAAVTGPRLRPPTHL